MTRKSLLWATLWLVACSTTEEAGSDAAGAAGQAASSTLGGSSATGGASGLPTGSGVGGAASGTLISTGGSSGGAQGSAAVTGGTAAGGARTAGAGGSSQVPSGGQGNGTIGGGTGNTSTGGATSPTGGATSSSGGSGRLGSGGIGSATGGAATDDGAGSGGTGSATGGAATDGAGSGGTGSGGAASGGAGLGGAGLGGTGLGGLGGEPAAGSDVVAELETYLAVPRAERGPIEEEPFAEVPLSLEQAGECSELLWEDYAELVRETRQAEHENRAITLGEYTLRYDFTVFGDKPATGRSLFLSLHGGGNADPSVNDEQWQNQMTLYQPDEGIYLCPRAPTDTWNLWHEAHIDPLFERLISDLIVLEDVNPERVYVMGYSAGGDGVYQLGPRMADHFAAASAMAGHPNDAKPLSLRNIGFTIHVGALDTSYDRNLVAQEWSDDLDALEAADPGGYPHFVQIHEGKEHWMDLEDAVAVPWMAEFTRDPTPDKIVWYQDDVPHTRFYWLAVEEEEALAATEVRATLTGQAINLETTGLTRVKVRLADSMLDLSQPVSISANGEVRYSGLVSRTISTLARTLDERGDPHLVFSGEVTVEW